MTATVPTPAVDARALPRVVFTHRDDPLVPYLGQALRAGFDVVDEVEADLSSLGRLLVAAATVRPGRRWWHERYVKSRLGVAGRSRRVRRGLARAASYDVVFATHALYEVSDPRTVVYVDCTHRQSVASWPDWNPLRGRALARWLDRERRQYHAAAHVFAFSRATRDSLVHGYGVPPERVTVVGAGLDFAAVPAKRPADADAPVLLFVGNDFRRKGGEELLDAFEVVRREIPGARLQLVGSGCPSLDRPGVEVLGEVTDRARLSELYAGATVFCLPAHFEPFGLVLLEAMAHGLPCVTTASCGIPDIVVDGVTGSVVADGDALAPDLADALLRLLRSTQTVRAQGEAGRRRVQEQFLWTHVVERMRPAIDALSARDVPQTQPQLQPQPQPTTSGERR